MEVLEMKNDDVVLLFVAGRSYREAKVRHKVKRSRWQISKHFYQCRAAGIR
jgi:hypothetical protein